MATEIQTRSMASIVAELKEELTDFVRTRGELLKRELTQKAGTFKTAAPVALVSALFLITAYLLLTLAVVSLIVVGFQGSPYAWFFAFLIAGLAWLIIGAVAAFWVKQQVSRRGIVPTETLQVLKADKSWLQQEAKQQL